MGGGAAESMEIRQIVVGASNKSGRRCKPSDEINLICLMYLDLINVICLMYLDLINLICLKYLDLNVTNGESLLMRSTQMSVPF